MKKILGQVFQILFVLVFFLSGSGIRYGSAQDLTPEPTEVPAVEVTEEVLSQPSETEQIPTEITTELPVEDLALTITPLPIEEPPVDETVADVVQLLAEEEVVLVDGEGEPLPLGSTEAETALVNDDPWYQSPLDASQVVVYLSDCSGWAFVPANYPGYSGGSCYQTSTPIQTAIDSAPDGTTIHLEAATFVEQVDIDNRDLTITGAGSSTIISGPSTLVQTNGSGDAYGYGNYYALFYIHNGSVVNLSNMTFDGTSITTVPTNAYYGGVLIDDASATISGVIFQDFRNTNANRTGVGLLLDDINGNAETSYLILNGNTFNNNEFGIFGTNDSDNLYGSGNVFTGNDVDSNRTISTDKKLQICHWDNGQKVYSTRTVSVNSLFKSDCTEKNGGHAAEHPNDIIPPYQCDASHSYPGQGDQTVLANGCQAVLPPCPVGQYRSGATCVAPSISVAKTVTSSGPYHLGDTITFNITVTNTSAIAIHNVTITDPAAVLGTCPATVTLLPGASKTCTASHVVTLADIAAGKYSNVATGDSDETDPKDSSTVNVTVTASPKISVTKTVTSTGPYTLGSTITFQIDVTNTGDVELHNVTIADPAAPFAAGTCLASTTLAVGATKTCTTSHVVTAADVTAGKFDNVATGDSNETSPKSSMVSVPITPSPAITVLKSVTSSGPYILGSVINYKIDVTNSGDVVLHNVTIADPAAPFAAGTCLASSTLAVGATKTCTTSHTVTQTDLDAGFFSNTATGDSNETASQDSTVRTPLTQSPAISVLKSVTSSGPYVLGSVIAYQIDVTNTGNITLNNVTIADPAAPFAAGTCLASTTLAVGATKTCTTSHTVTQADLDAGFFSNTATGDSNETASQDSTVRTPLTQSPAISVLKSVTSSGPYVLGSVIAYQIDVTNTGNITLNNVTIIDPAAPFAAGTCLASTTLAVGATKTCTTSHTVTQADLDAGFFSNTATGDSNETASQDSTVRTPLTQSPAISVLKSVTSTGVYVLGSTITYDIVVTNTGNITLTNVSITDPAAILGTCLVDATLAVGASKTCTASHVVTAADVTAGTFTNTGTGDSDQTAPVDSTVISTITAPAIIPPVIVPVTGGGGGLPIPVTGGTGGLLIPVTGGNLIVSGLGHSCMPYGDGRVICWGLNASGQLGDGTFVDKNVAVYVEDIENAQNLTAGSKHTCALTIDGEVWCWGENSSGQLGNGTTKNSNVPVKVDGLTEKVVGFTAGENFTCVQLINQEVWCWGENGLGQLNDGTTKNQLKPVKSQFTTLFSQISGGQGLLLGSDIFGSVGNWAKVQTKAVQQVSNALSISANRWGLTGCAVLGDGSIKCWGSDLISSLIQNELPAIEVGAGLDHDCAINNDETISCWGANGNGELGNGTLEDSSIATLVKNLKLAHALAVGAQHTCTLVGTTNTPMCWGDNTYGQLGNNSNKDSNVPVYVILPAQ